MSYWSRVNAVFFSLITAVLKLSIESMLSDICAIFRNMQIWDFRKSKTYWIPNEWEFLPEFYHIHATFFQVHSRHIVSFAESA